MFPFLDEAIDYVEDEYEEWRNQTYGMDTPYQDAIAKARLALYYQKVYQNYYDYYQKYNPYNTRLSNYRNYNNNKYTKSPLEVYNALDKNRKYEEQQRFYRERSKQYNKMSKGGKVLDVSLTYKPHAKQLLLHNVPATFEDLWICLFGGSRGGGKSAGMLMDAVFFATTYPGAKICILRESLDAVRQSFLFR